MSAYLLGRRLKTRKAYSESFRNTSNTKLEDFIGRVVKWIPTDVIALFTAAITAVNTRPTGGGSKALLAIFAVVVTPGAVLIGAWSSGNQGKPWLTNGVWIRTVLAAIAFLIWSPTVPQSGWQAWGVVHDNPGWVTVGCAIAAFFFAQAASRFGDSTN